MYKTANNQQQADTCPLFTYMLYIFYFQEVIVAGRQICFNQQHISPYMVINWGIVEIVGLFNFKVVNVCQCADIRFITGIIADTLNNEELNIE